MTEDVDGLIERQRADDDCTICAIAMATGLSYERVMEAAVAMDAGGYRYAGKPGTMSPKGLLMALGFEATRVGLAAIPPGHAKSLLWGRRAILSIPSLNGFPGHHDVYWDGRAIRDPSQKLTYPPNAAWSFQPIWAVLLDDASALHDAQADLARRDEVLNAFYDATWELVAALAAPRTDGDRLKAAQDAARRLCLAEHERRRKEPV